MAKQRLQRSCLYVLLFLFASFARAEFHFWQINEIYSNADGSVQFIELTTSAGGQQFIAGHTITSSRDGQTQTYTFPTNLPGDTTNKSFLIGTQGFAALNIVTPDYIVPDHFLFTPNGSVNFASVDSLTYASLPVDGDLALLRNGSTSPNSPTSFSGVTGSVEFADYTGAWYNANESGWGLTVIRGGSGYYGIVMYHYDEASRPTWYWLSGGNFTGNTYTAPISRFSGPPVNATTFNPAQVSSVDVGSVTIEFTSATTATLTYTISGSTVSKSITKLEF